ncbi:GEM-like protein [Drosera capensis]
MGRKQQQLGTKVIDWLIRLHMGDERFQSKAACGQVKLAAKAVSKGGFRSIFKQNLATEPNEKLRKTFSCYLSATAGPVAGTLYLSTVRIGFHSDSPLSIADPSGQEAWCNYQVMIPWEKMSSVNPVTNNENPQERFIEMDTGRLNFLLVQLAPDENRLPAFSDATTL